MLFIDALETEISAHRGLTLRHGERLACSARNKTYPRPATHCEHTYVETCTARPLFSKVSQAALRGMSSQIYFPANRGDGSNADPLKISLCNNYVKYAGKVTLDTLGPLAWDVNTFTDTTDKRG